MIHNTYPFPPVLRYGLAVQHLLAVFAGTIFVPTVLGLPIALALLFSGVGTLMFHYFTDNKMPLYFSSSFTVLAGMAYIRLPYKGDCPTISDSAMSVSVRCSSD